MKNSMIASLAGGILALGLAAGAASAAPASSAGVLKGLSGQSASQTELIRHRHWHRRHCRLVKRCWINRWGNRRCTWVRRCGW